MREQVKRYSVDCPLAYPPLDGERKVVLATDYDALHADAEALRAQVSALQTDANSWQSGYDKGREDGAKAAEGWKAQHARDSAELRRLCAERDALRAENGRMNAQFNECARLFVDATEQACEAQRVRDALAVELEAARGLLQHLASVMAGHDQAPEEYNALAAARDFTATPAPEVPDHTERNLEMVEQGERQEAVAEYQQLSRYGNWDRVDKAVYDLGKLGDTPDKFRALYTTPQPGPDVRVLAASLYQACGAYDMPERILDALSAAANGEPFAHMIDGLLPCVPPSDQEVRSLLSADDVRDACANAVSVFAEETNADQCREVAEYMREVLLAQIAHRQAQPQ